jgi:hypothetical protein
MDAKAQERLQQFLALIEHQTIDEKKLQDPLFGEILHNEFEKRYLLNDSFKGFKEIHSMESMVGVEIVQLIEDGGLPYKIVLEYSDDWLIRSFEFQCVICFGEDSNCGVCGGSGWGVL